MVRHRLGWAQAEAGVAQPWGEWRPPVQVPWLLVTVQVLSALSALAMLLAELPDAPTGLHHHLLRHRDHHAEEVGVLEALPGEAGGQVSQVFWWGELAGGQRPVWQAGRQALVPPSSCPLSRCRGGGRGTSRRQACSACLSAALRSCLGHRVLLHRLTVAGRQNTDCSAISRSVNSTSFSNSGNCSIWIPTWGGVGGSCASEESWGQASPHRPPVAQACLDASGQGPRGRTLTMRYMAPEGRTGCSPQTAESAA